MQSIYFDLTRIKKLDFDSSYFYSFCLYTRYYWEAWVRISLLTLVFIEIYLIIFNSYNIVMTGYMQYIVSFMCPE